MLLSFSVRICQRLAGIMIILAALVVAPSLRAQQDCATEPRPGCQSKARIDLVFVLDESGSVRERGQTYNIEIRGVAQALRDPTIIPYDGTVAITVVTFAETAFERVPQQIIDSPAKAEAAAQLVDRLQSTDICVSQGLLPASNYFPAISLAGKLLNGPTQDATGSQTRPNRAILLVTDGEPTDLKKAVEAAEALQAEAKNKSAHLRLDTILLGQVVGTKEFNDSKDRLDDLVFRVPVMDLASETRPIAAGDCNLICASPSGENCDEQVRRFGELTRQVLRSYVTPTSFVVTTAGDTEPGQPVSDNSLSLRQAIEQANCRQGATTITFAESVRGKVISPRIPLPALTAPDISIDGCSDPACAPAVTIDGLLTDTSKGERHEDGLLIRSNYDGVRGLKITRCKRAGIEIAATCPFDFVGHTLIELNTLENNAKAGVMVIDPPPAIEAASVHNVGNRVSKNGMLIEKIPAQVALLDLGGDGPTANDDGDADNGPNTLINFSDSLNVVASSAVAARQSPGVLAAAAADTFTVSGQSFSPRAANATVEIFAITRLRAEANRLLVEGVAYVQQTTVNASGAFIATGVPPSPTGAYTATLTDQNGNTSELMFGCGGAAQMVKTLEGGGDVLDFGRVAVPDFPKPKKQRARRFTIQNVGCSPLNLTFVSLRRSGAEASRLDASQDDTRIFSVKRVVNLGQSEVEQDVSFASNAASFSINPGSSETFVVRLLPIVPPVPDCQCNSNLPPADVLPDHVTSTISLRQNGKLDTIELSANLKTDLRLINPIRREPRQPPRVILTRSGDELMVEYSIYDSNLDVQTASYEFFDKSKQRVPLKPANSNLAALIQGVVRGESFTVKQKFSNANEHPEIDFVRVTVRDGEATVLANSNSLLSLSAAARTLRFQRARRAALLVSPVKLRSALHKDLPHARRAANVRRYYRVYPHRG